MCATGSMFVLPLVCPLWGLGSQGAFCPLQEQVCNWEQARSPAQTLLEVVSTSGQSSSVMSTFGQRNPGISRKSLAESAQNSRETQPPGRSVPTPRDRGLSPERTLWPLPREGTLASPAPVPREAKVARGTPVPREDIWRGQARKTEYANDPVLPICKGGVDIVS